MNSRFSDEEEDDIMIPQDPGLRFPSLLFRRRWWRAPYPPHEVFEDLYSDLFIF
jgi:hypothetical protein